MWNSQYDDGAVATAPERQEATEWSRGTILVVDDDRDQVRVLTMSLERQGFRPLIAETGEEALQLARHHHPDLVLLDIRLPDIDGIAVCQRLSEDSETCCIPVIMLTGMERPDIVRQTRAAGCQYYVRKPYDPNALLLLIKNAIEPNLD